MKVIHIVKGDAKGAYTAAYRLNEALMQQGVESMILTKDRLKKSIFQAIWFLLAKINQKKLGKLVEDNRYYFTDDEYGMNPFHISEILNADIVNFHWVSAGLVGRNTIKILNRLNKPVVWTLHDMRPFTGGCHYDCECGGYVDGCKDCKATNKATYSSNTVTQNKAVYESCGITIIGCSKWITNSAKKSYAMSNLRCVNIKNCIDIGKYYPIEKKLAREKLGLTSFDNKKLIMFGAMSSTSDPRKGYHLLEKALKNLDSDKYVCVIFGGMGEKLMGGIQTVSIGQLHRDEELMIAYSAADIFLAPSIQENLANTVVEAMSCGTPVVAFKIGGMPDMIVHKETGYLAKPFDCSDFANGIVFLSKTDCSENARNKIVDEFSYENIASQYTRLYSEILANESNKEING